MKRLLLLGVLLFSGVSVQADTVAYIKGGTFTASVQYGSRPAYQESQDYYNGPRTLRYLAEEVYGVRKRLKEAFDKGVSERVAQEGGEFTLGKLSGPIEATVVGVGGYLNSIVIGGFSYGGYVSVTQKRWGISVTCNASVVLEGVKIETEYDAQTARVDPVKTKAEFNPIYGVNHCDSSLSWIPLLGRIVDLTAEHYAQKLLGEYVNQLPGQITSFIIGEINGTANVAQRAFSPNARLWGDDGAAPLLHSYLQSNAQWLFTGRTFRVHLGEEPKAFRSNTIDDVVKEAYAFKFDFSDQNNKFELSLKDSRLFSFAWVCRKPPLGCVPDY
ncbi:hypothetical protein LZ017_14415 [Pelomonas sp. CA6]|uniref:hypothetical protein n=1 Tax=Pelomonas sp. CA6 TaxID=2907999 RepID=UPI001F4C4A72|nr:hypothetical protein [Pelomonas sp. CA6]MCH7344571.1 hypothetical protein [Pelomonas sp. CA6]